MAVPKPVQSAYNAVSTVFWTAAYFVYFLFKGKREWKCEKESKPNNITYCCVDGSTCSDHQNHSELRQRKNHQTSSSSQFENNNHHNSNGYNHTDNHNATPKSFYVSHSGIRGYFQSAWNSVKNGATKVWEYTKHVGRKIWNGTKTVIRFIWQLIRCLFAVIKAFLFSNNVPSQTLPSTPKPYSVKPSSPSYNKVAFQFEPIQENLDEAELKSATKQEIEDEDEKTIYEDVSRRDELKSNKVPDTSESFYYERVFEEPPTQKPLPQIAVQPAREKSAPPPPPPPPPKPVSREVSRARSTTPGRAMTPGKDRKEVKGGIGGFKSDIMDELEEHQRARQERASVQREMTQSCHPDMAQWKQNEVVDRSANSTPWRASSVGPTMRKLEQVVSRIDGYDDKGEANFVFRPKIVHSSEEYQNKNRANNDYLMGRSVFTPVEEAEQIRQEINSKKTNNYSNHYSSPHNHQQSYSSPHYQNGNWMENQRSRNVHRADQINDYQAAKNPFGSAAYKSSPYASHTARRSKTPVRYGEPEGGVETIARQWPPTSNATAAIGTPRDEWIGNSMRRPEENDDGLIMTMCRRVVEKKKDENWKWRDESGRLLDEKNKNTWKGELDTLLRDGPNEGRHWSRTVEKLPTGDTRFQDVNRQYNREFVVESVVRNY